VIVGLVTGRRRVELREMAEPEPSPGRAVVEIACCGVCGTDLEAWASGSPYSPALCGHEWAGTVSKLPADVRNLREGERVAIGIAPACGACEPCRAGDAAHCQPAFLGMLGRGPLAAAHGGFARAIAVEAARLVPVKGGLSDETAALLEPTAVALHAVRRTGLRVGDTALVLGAGPIGLLVLQCALAAGAGAVALLEPQPVRRERAKQLGASVALDPMQEDLAARLREALGALGPDVVFECAGAAGTLAQAGALVRRGGTVSLVGLAAGPAEIQPGAWLAQELRLVASLGYEREEFALVQDLLLEGRLASEALVSARAPLRALPDVFERLHSHPDELKVLIDPRA
jgi:(R,R)-butanediol dehydrogenase/meso-butanediol dehydrogenase/diacetyl reductase